MSAFTDPVDAVKAVLGMPRETPLDYPELVHPEKIDHAAEAEQAARAGKYEIATFHALMRIGDLLKPQKTELNVNVERGSDLDIDDLKRSLERRFPDAASIFPEAGL